MTYKALETIYTVLVTALSASEALTGSSEFGSCVCEQMAPGLRWGILWEELQVKKHSPDTDQGQLTFQSVRIGSENKLPAEFWRT